jgi:hypothetical protein
MSQILRGTILSFDSATWTAAVLLDGSDAETVMPVGEWVPAGMLDAADEAAVLIFGGTNNDDGLILGAYGSVSTYNYPELSGLTAGAVLRATGAGSAAFGAVDLADADAVTGTLPVSYLGTTQSPTFGALNLGSASGAATGGAFLQASASNQYVIRLNDTSGNNRAGFQYQSDGSFDLSMRDTGGTESIVGDSSAGVLNVTGSYKKSGTQVVGARATGYTNAMTGTKNRATAYATGTITLVQLAERVGALLDDLTTHGLIGT